MVVNLVEDFSQTDSVRVYKFSSRGLDMSGFTLGRDDMEGSLYDLFAVANHTGTVNFGHYTAFARLPETDTLLTGLRCDGLGGSHRLYTSVVCSPNIPEILCNNPLSRNFSELNLYKNAINCFSSFASTSGNLIF